MFAMVDVTATGMEGAAYAADLLERAGVAVMPGASFGTSLRNWVRVALTVEDAAFDAAIARMIAHARGLGGAVPAARDAGRVEAS